MKGLIRALGRVLALYGIVGLLVVVWVFLAGFQPVPGRMSKATLLSVALTVAGYGLIRFANLLMDD